MIQFDYVITDPEGIHARPAGVIVKQAKEFTSSIKVTKDGKTADAKKIFTLMGLAAKCGNTITITVEGEDEAAAAEAMQVALKENI